MKWKEVEMYHLFTRQTDGVWINEQDFNTVQEAKVYADQYWPHADCQVKTILHGTGNIITWRSATGTWQ